MPCALASRYSAQLRGGEPESLIGRKFWHEIVVVCVEPFGHLNGRRTFATMRVSSCAAFMGHLALRASSMAKYVARPTSPPVQP
jgi:hypothetical protein